jgi:enamine deaminase RidA (YjgF/YER057c/UK114 family)
MPQRLNISSGSPYEPIGGFSRAVRIGNFVSVAGTAPIAEDGKAACPGDPAGQTRRCLTIIQNALEDAGASLSDVVRTRLLLTRIADWKEIMAAHGEFFKDVRPASTVMEVSALIDPEWLIEIEADAVVA